MLQATIKQELAVKSEVDESNLNHQLTGVKDEGSGLGSSELDSHVTKPSAFGNFPKPSVPNEKVGASSVPTLLYEHLIICHLSSIIFQGKFEFRPCCTPDIF